MPATQTAEQLRIMYGVIRNWPVSGNNRGVSQHPERAEPKLGRRPITRAQLTLEGLRKLPRVVWLLGLASLLNDVSSEAMPLLPTFLASLGAPMSFLGLIKGSADALSSLIKMAAGKLSDRGPRRTLVASGYAMPAIARALIAVAMAPWQVLGARLFDRTGKGIRSGPRDALIADSVAPSQRGRAFGLNRSMDHLGAALGPVIAWALLSMGASLRTTFAVASVFGLLAPAVLFFRLRETEQLADRSGPLDARPRGGALRPGFRPTWSPVSSSPLETRRTRSCWSGRARSAGRPPRSHCCGPSITW